MYKHFGFSVLNQIPLQGANNNMLLALEKKELLKTISILTTPFIVDKDNINFNEVKLAYIRLLNDMQPEIPHSESLYPEYIVDPILTKNLIGFFSLESNHDDTYYDLSGDSSIEENKQVLNNVKVTSEKLGEIVPSFRWFYDLVFNQVFYANSVIAAGGTTSTAVGTLFLDPRKYWLEEDLFEFLIHELDHTLLFLHEWAYGLFKSHQRLGNPETFALSAIRGQNRPMDKAFHSAIVATDIVLLREYYLGHDHNFNLHPPTTDLLTSIKLSFNSIIEVNQKEDILTDSALSLVKNCQMKLNKILIGVE